MNQVEKALWYIESHHAQPVTLDDVARVAGASRYHLSRVFSYATGLTLKRYLRDRRLSLAAVQLANCTRPVVDTALGAGYGSHEAFTRAFRERFGVTPESVQRQGHVDNLLLQEAIRMNPTRTNQLAAPRFVESGPLLLAGINRRCKAGNNADIPSQWQAFNALEGTIEGATGDCAYGIVHNIDEDNNFDYLCAIAVTSFDHVPERFDRLRLARQEYAVFFHGGHVSEVQAVCGQIWGDWLPASGHEAADAPFFEAYPNRTFDPVTGYGGFEIWLPVR